MLQVRSPLIVTRQNQQAAPVCSKVCWICSGGLFCRCSIAKKSVCPYLVSEDFSGWFFFLLAVHLVAIRTAGNTSANRKKSHFPDIGKKGPLFHKEPPFLPQTRFEATPLGFQQTWGKSCKMFARKWLCLCRTPGQLSFRLNFSLPNPFCPDLSTQVVPVGSQSGFATLFASVRSSHAGRSCQAALLFKRPTVRSRHTLFVETDKSLYRPGQKGTRK